MAARGAELQGGLAAKGTAKGLIDWPMDWPMGLLTVLFCLSYGDACPLQQIRQHRVAQMQHCRSTVAPRSFSVVPSASSTWQPAVESRGGQDSFSYRSDAFRDSVPTNLRK